MAAILFFLSGLFLGHGLANLELVKRLTVLRKYFYKRKIKFQNPSKHKIIRSGELIEGDIILPDGYLCNWCITTNPTPTDINTGYWLKTSICAASGTTVRFQIGYNSAGPNTYNLEILAWPKKYGSNPGWKNIICKTLVNEFTCMPPMFSTVQFDGLVDLAKPI